MLMYMAGELPMMTILAMLLACKHDNGLQHRTDVEGPNDWEEILVEPTRLMYGDLSYGEQFDIPFTISNIGTDNSILSVTEVTFESSDGTGYEILNPPEPTDLRITDDPIEVTVRFTSWDPGEQLGQLVVHSDDEKSPATPVFMEANGIMPRLEISPNPYDYGEVTVGCERDNVFTLANTGTDVLQIDAIANEAFGFTVIDRPVLPLTLLPGENAAVTVGFVPADDKDGLAFEANLQVQSSDPRGEQEVPQIGRGVFPGNYQDVYEVPATGAIDLLFVLDKSVSMAEEHETVAANANAFAAGLASATDDWRILVVSDDSGCNTGGIITPETLDYVNVFANAVLAGAEGWYSEWGFHLADLALEQTGGFQCNEGFVREDALLHVIFLTDEEDQSPEYWYTYVEQFQALKGAKHLLKFSVVGGDERTGCDSETNHAGPAKGYIEAARATHGGVASICSPDWHTQISTFASFGITRDTFALSHMPDVTTLTTLVNGVRRSTGWHYMSDSNSVIFDELPPQSGDVANFDYFVPYTCY